MRMTTTSLSDRLATGDFAYIPQAEFERVNRLSGTSPAGVELFARMARCNALYAITRAGSGHIGSSFSSLDIVSWLHLRVMDHARGDIYFSSKGHDVPGYYAVATALGSINFDMLHALRRLDGLPGHPDVGTPGIACNTGSLGMGVSKAKGMVLANRFHSSHGRVFVLTGDGELQEGQFWESLSSAANLRMGEITVIVDHNKLQSDTLVREVSDLGDLEAKFRAFGWVVAQCNGHDVAALERTFGELSREEGKPKAIIANTIKGRGVSFMEHTAMPVEQRYYKYHSGAPSPEMYLQSVIELAAGIDAATTALAIEPVRYETVPPSSRATGPDERQKLIPFYGDALLNAAANDERIVALDADLILDTGLIPFRERFPERFIECGIAEQDMVSMASGMALKGLRPVVHSFACFLSARANEQIYNAATEGGRIVYVGSLAGLTPAGPGHSHQAVRDVSSLAAVPGLSIVEPSLPDEVEPLLRWCLQDAPGSAYFRIVSAPTLMPAIRADFTPRYGWGREMMAGADIAIVTYGPVLIQEAWTACTRLLEQGVAAGLHSFPWLNHVDPDWLEGMAQQYPVMMVVDNHYLVGGLADRIAAEMVEHGIPIRLHTVGVDSIPVCGTNEQALRAHRMDADSLVERALELLNPRRR